MKTWGSVGIVPKFLTSTTDGSKWSGSHPGRFTRREIAPGTHWIGLWVSHGTGLEAVEKRKTFPLPGIEPGPSSLSLYRLLILVEAHGLYKKAFNNVA
jgi:hypothetical protein